MQIVVHMTSYLFFPSAPMRLIVSITQLYGISGAMGPTSTSKKLVGGAAGQAFAVGTAVLHKGLLLEQAQNEALLAFKTSIMFSMALRLKPVLTRQASGVAVSLLTMPRPIRLGGPLLMSNNYRSMDMRIDVGGMIVTTYSLSQM